MPKDPPGEKRLAGAALQKLQDRARELADTGQYPDAYEVAEALAAEGWENPVRRLSKDEAAWGAIDLRCADARKGRV